MNDASSAYKGDDFYCDEVLNGRTPVNIVTETQHVRSLLEIEQPLLMELMLIIQQAARAVADEHGACFVLTNIGEYQDSKHLHWHVAFGERIR